MKSSFELGCEQPHIEEKKPKKKSLTKKMNPVTRELVGSDREDGQIVKIVEMFEKSCTRGPFNSFLVNMCQKVHKLCWDCRWIIICFMGLED